MAPSHPGTVRSHCLVALSGYGRRNSRHPGIFRRMSVSPPGRWILCWVWFVYATLVPIVCLHVTYPKASDRRPICGCRPGASIIHFHECVARRGDFEGTYAKTESIPLCLCVVSRRD